jgi:hypothetical protein
MAAPKAGVGEVSPLSQSLAVFFIQTSSGFSWFEAVFWYLAFASKKAREKRILKAQLRRRDWKCKPGSNLKTTLDRSGWRRHRSMLDDLVAQKSGVGAGAMFSRSGAIVELWWRIQWRLSADPGAVFD